MDPSVGISHCQGTLSRTHSPWCLLIYWKVSMQMEFRMFKIKGFMPRVLMVWAHMVMECHLSRSHSLSRERSAFSALLRSSSTYRDAGAESADCEESSREGRGRPQGIIRCH